MPDKLEAARTAIAAKTLFGDTLLIAIDGMKGVGKSTRVAPHLGPPVIGLDSHLKRTSAPYVERIRYPALQKELAGYADRAVVVEGVCVRAVLGRLGLTPHLNVYVRRIGLDGLWPDEDIALGDRLQEELAKEESTARVLKLPMGGLTLDLIRYHARFRPYQSADVVVDLVNGR